jgi:Xaa-Pro aminopeptidase
MADAVHALSPELPALAEPLLPLGGRCVSCRLVALDHPMEISTGMVVALETYCPAADGYSAARIEEEVVVTDVGCKVISRFPAEDLPIANAYLSGGRSFGARLLAREGVR